VGPHQAPGTRRRRQQCSSARPGMPHCHAALRVRARARASDVPRPGCIARRHWAGSRPQLRAMSRGRGCAWSSTDARGASVPPRSCAARTAAQAQPAASAAMATARLRTCAAHGACRRSAGTTHSWDHAFPTSAIALAGRTQPLRRTVAALPERQNSFGHGTRSVTSSTSLASVCAHVRWASAGTRPEPETDSVLGPAKGKELGNKSLGSGRVSDQEASWALRSGDAGDTGKAQTRWRRQAPILRLRQRRRRRRRKWLPQGRRAQRAWLDTEP